MCVWSCRDGVTKQVEAVGRLGCWWLVAVFPFFVPDFD